MFWWNFEGVEGGWSVYTGAIYLGDLSVFDLSGWQIWIHDFELSTKLRPSSRRPYANIYSPFVPSPMSLRQKPPFRMIYQFHVFLGVTPSALLYAYNLISSLQIDRLLALPDSFNNVLFLFCSNYSKADVPLKSNWRMSWPRYNGSNVKLTLSETCTTSSPCECTNLQFRRSLSALKTRE